MLNSLPSLPYGAPAATVIAPGRSPWLILVPGMEQPIAKNRGLTFFLQDICLRSGQGFASFQSARPEAYDDIAHSMATGALLRRAVAAYGRPDDPLHAIVAAAPRERVVAQRLVTQTKGLPDVNVAPVIFDPQVFDSLPARVAFAKTLVQTATSLRNQRLAQFSRS